jgi:hypothetical protein
MSGAFPHLGCSDAVEAEAISLNEITDGPRFDIPCHHS